MFLFAYRAFLDAYASQDTKTLQKMCEPKLFRMLQDNFRTINQHNMKPFLSLPNKRRMKASLTDMMQVEGVYIDRTKNLPTSHYEHETLS